MAKSIRLALPTTVTGGSRNCQNYVRFFLIRADAPQIPALTPLSDQRQTACIGRSALRVWDWTLRKLSFLSRARDRSRGKKNSYQGFMRLQFAADNNSQNPEAGRLAKQKRKRS